MIKFLRELSAVLLIAFFAAPMGFAQAIPHGSYVSGGQVTPAAPSGGTATFARVYTGDGTAALPSYSFTSDPDTGFYWDTGNQVAISLGGTKRGYFLGNLSGLAIAGAGGGTLTLGGNGQIELTSSGTNQNITLTPSGTGGITSTSDAFAGLVLTRGTTANGGRAVQFTNGAGNSWVVGAQGSGGTPASGFSISSGTTFSGNHLNIATSGNVLLGTNTDSANGRLQLATHTTSAGGIGFGTDTSLSRLVAAQLTLEGAGNARLRVKGTSAGNTAGIWLVPNNNADAASCTIRATAAAAPALELYSNDILALTLDSSQNATFAGDVVLGGSAKVISWTGKSKIYGGATDGIVALFNSAQNDFSRLQFGGTTNSFPSLKRSGTQLQVRLADDSAFAAINARGYVGTTTNDSATAGEIGEYVTATAGPFGLTTATPAGVTSISLTAGDWDVSGAIEFQYVGTTATYVYAGFSTSSGLMESMQSAGGPRSYTTVTNNESAALPTARISLSGTTTVYLTAQADFSAGTVDVTGKLMARRVR